MEALMAKSDSVELNCPMEIGLNLLSGKWRLRIVWLLLKGPIRFNELQRKLQPITTKTLTRELRDLEYHGLIRRTVFPEVPPKVEYSITALGNSVQPILKELCIWGEAYRTTAHK